MLGGAERTTREFAADELAAQGDDAVQALYWGRRATDPEIRDKCLWLWCRLFVCPECHGQGDESYRIDNSDYLFWSDCLRCCRSGDTRYDLVGGVWDGYEAVERDCGRVERWESPRRGR